MHTPKLRPPMGACEITKQGRSKDKCTSCCSSLRWWLTVWACGRLLVSVLWTVVLLFVTFKDYMNPNERYSQDHSILAIRYLIFTFGVIATLAQLVEFGMLVTFIVAGIKRSAFLYRAYYRYCILTLIIYIIAMTLCFALNYRHVHFIGDIYLTYHFQNIFEDVNSTCIIVFGVAVGLNILLSNNSTSLRVLKDKTYAMHTSKMRPQMGACEINKQGRSNDEGSSCCLSLRCWLLVWACMRLVVSVLWTISLLLWSNLDSLEPERASYDSNAVLAFGVIAILAQLVEFGMLVTFIVAGIKRSAHLYLAYYRYCILTLIIYIIAVVLCLTLDYFDGHWFGEIYLTYHYNDFAVQIVKNGEILFGAAAILDICLEILLIYSIKRLINKYQYNAGYGFGENI